MLTVKGAFQGPLARIFGNESYATQFAHEGRARLWRIDHFRKMEAPMGDPSEGIGRLAPQEIPFVKWGATGVHASVEAVSETPTYILCFHDAFADLKRLAGSRKYGVLVRDPLVLNSAVPFMTVQVPDDRHVVSLRVGQVRYDKGGQRPIPDPMDAFELAFLQKDASFGDDKEWRIALFLSGQMAGSPEYLDVVIPFADKLELVQV